MIMSRAQPRQSVMEIASTTMKSPSNALRHLCESSALQNSTQTLKLRGNCLFLFVFKLDLLSSSLSQHLIWYSHTMGHICFLCKAEGEADNLFTGDTLFVAGCGR